MRVGIGYDSHAFAEGRTLILGGVEIDYPRGLAGHSDADVIAHAITDAILGATSLGDIGQHFPATDERWRDADSIALLDQAVRLASEQNYQVVNVDVTVICESPRLAPYIELMCERLAGALGIARRLVSVKGKTNESMGWIGRGEGIAAMAVVLVNRIEG